MNIEPNAIYTVAEVSSLLRTTKTNVYNLLATGQLAKLQLGAGKKGYRVQGKDLLLFLDSRRSGGPQPKGAIKHLAKWVS